MIREIARRLLGNALLGSLDYYRSTDEDRNWSGPFNGQEGRIEIFETLHNHFEFRFAVETGTFRGVTTAFLAQRIQGPVLSVESNRRNYGFARARLRGRRNVELYVGDSASCVAEILRMPRLPGGRGFFYLDAHWERQLPIRQEVATIFSSRDDAVVMIDDFRVEGDPDYEFDDYGTAGSLTVDYLADLFRRLELSVFFPARPSSLETGKRRGMVVLGRGSAARTMRSMPALREWSNKGL